MKLYNTLTKRVETVQPLPLDGKTVRMYSCGPTVYDHAHIGNLSAYIFADTLRRSISLLGHDIKHVMNYTDVDDKTIRRSLADYPHDDPRQGLRELTDTYIAAFNEDMRAVGNDVASLTFVRATDPQTIQGMQDLISRLHDKGIAYVADDGVYFSIEAYRKSGKTYGQLLEITAASTSDARIQNDEYDKESIHDFALWKKQKPGEPAWEFTLDGHQLNGRPGWHIECSVMSQQNLSQPFDIHTGGVDLIFPHHENEIAQSTALTDNPVMATVFAHNDHILIDGKKMSKSAQNFFTLQDITAKGFDPLAFRMLVLQAHYRSQVNFTWESLAAAQNRLHGLYAMADLQWQATPDGAGAPIAFNEYAASITNDLTLHDLDTPQALADLSAYTQRITGTLVSHAQLADFKHFLAFLDQAFGFALSTRPDITGEQKQLITGREAARAAKDWAKSDELRDQLLAQGVTIRDTAYGPIWYRTVPHRP